MNPRQGAAPAPAGRAKFDLLRVRLEGEVERPAVIALTSSTEEDGREIAARGLAFSLASAGYSTLLVDTSLDGPSQSNPVPGIGLFEIARMQPIPDARSGTAAVLELNDLTLQTTTSQRGLHAALEMLRSKFDYVVINTEYGASSSFATSVVGAADAVLVSVKKGRREEDADARLSAVLKHVGSRFLGVVALDPSVIGDEPDTPASAPVREGRRSLMVRMEKEHQLREIAESPI